MELNGNVWERPVTVGNTQGRAYSGVLGNGALDATGNADGDTWPGTDASGAGFRGSGWGSGDQSLRVSDRGVAAETFSIRFDDSGGRGVRVFP
jgi:hypothetical protein